MLPEYKKRANVGVGLGLLLQFLAVVMKQRLATGLELLCLISGVILFFWGCINYSKSKGYSGIWGLFGLGHLIGLMILISLPDRSESLSRTDVAPRGKKKMTLVYIALTAVAVAVAAVFLIPKLWHEYAYGAPLSNLQELPHAVSQFLRQPALDSTKVRVETSISGASGGSDDVGALAEYLRGKVGSRTGGAELVLELKRINTISDPLQAIDSLLTTLIRSKDLIHDETHQDDVIVYIHYYLRQPSSLDPDARTAIASLIGKIDSARMARAFARGKCAPKLLHGNINIYPLAMENPDAYKSAGLPGNPRPMLEIRFMGLGGIFQYLLDQMNHASGLAFINLGLSRLETH